MRTAVIALSSCFLFLCCLTLPQSVSAHAGGGPPFLQINGSYAQNNTLYAGGSISVSQDVAPSTFLVNEPISFKIDLTKLLVPKDVIEKSTFRWSWQEGSKDYEYGTDLRHTYTQQGSYLMELAVKGPQDNDFLVLDTVQLDVLPNKDYKAPTAKIAVVGKTYALNKPIVFQSMVTKDPSAQAGGYEWHFGNELTSREAKATNVYKDQYLFDYIFLKFSDSNGFYTWDAIQVSGDNGKIEFFGMRPNATDVPIVAGGSLNAVKNTVSYAVILVLGVIVLVFAILLVSKKKRN